MCHSYRQLNCFMIPPGLSRTFGTDSCLSPCMINSVRAWILEERLHCIFFVYIVYIVAPSQIINVLWWYYFSKLIEFMDTFFFILRKNNHQITFLHIYHHASMLNIWWFVMNWVPCGHCECCSTTSSSSDSTLSSNNIYCSVRLIIQLL